MNRDIQDVINKINTIPIFDIAREAGLVQSKTYYNRSRNLPSTSGGQQSIMFMILLVTPTFGSNKNYTSTSGRTLGPLLAPNI